MPLRILGYCLMPNHWHLVLWPREDGELSRFMLRLSTTHVRRRYAHLHDASGGHLYQGRFKSFPVERDDHLLTLLRYVEGNAVRAKLVREARRWRWCSLAARADRADWLDPWPVEVPRDWPATVDELAADELQRLRISAQRGTPFGSAGWTQRMAERLGLENTLRPRGRPRKQRKLDK